MAARTRLRWQTTSIRGTPPIILTLIGARRCKLVDPVTLGPITAHIEEIGALRVGRPLTLVSVAGVARRTTWRAVVGGAAVGAAAVGTACLRVLINGRYGCR